MPTYLGSNLIKLALPALQRGLTAEGPGQGQPDILLTRLVQAVVESNFSLLKAGLTLLTIDDKLYCGKPALMVAIANVRFYKLVQGQDIHSEGHHPKACRIRRAEPDRACELLRPEPQKA